MLRMALLAGAIALWTLTGSRAADPADVDRLTSYSVMLGRAVGCGVAVDREAAAVGRWIDRNFSSDERALYLSIMMQGMRHHALEQRSGRSPDSCSSVRRSLSLGNWTP